MRFYANEKDTFAAPNGSVGVRTSGPWGTWAKIKNCPIQGTDLRLTVRCTNYADTYFSIPAVITYKKKHITGFVSSNDEGFYFVAYEYGKNHALLK